MRKLIFALLAISVVFASCKKEPKQKPAPAPAPESKADILKKHTWLQDQLIEDGDTVAVEDCEKDNEWKFSATELTIDMGKELCDTFETNLHINYVPNADYTNITFTEDSESFTYTIEALDNTQLVLSTTEEDNYKIIIKLKPKK